MTTRTDSWAAGLTEEQQWQLFYKSQRCHWSIAAAWAAKEYNLPEAPKKTAFYDWRSRLQREEHDHNLAQALVAQAQARRLAKDYLIDDKTAIASLMSTATEAAFVTHDGKLAAQLIQSALAVRDRSQRDRELDLKERAQKTKDEELLLAREKFEAAEKRLERVAEIADAARGGKVDPAKVADEIDRILGRKK